MAVLFPMISTYVSMGIFLHFTPCFHRTFATGAACRRRKPTPPNSWSCPHVGLACVLMLRPISPELVLIPDFRHVRVFKFPQCFCFTLLSI